MRHARKHLVSVNTIRRMSCNFGEVDELRNIDWSERSVGVLDNHTGHGRGSVTGNLVQCHVPPPVSGMREQSQSVQWKKLSQRAFLDPCSTTQSSYNFVTKLIKHSTPEIRDNFLGHNVNQTLLGAASTAKVRETSHRHQYNMQTERLIRLSHNKHNSLQRLSTTIRGKKSSSWPCTSPQFNRIIWTGIATFLLQDRQ